MSVDTSLFIFQIVDPADGYRSEVFINTPRDLADAFFCDAISDDALVLVIAAIDENNEPHYQRNPMVTVKRFIEIFAHKEDVA